MADPDFFLASSEGYDLEDPRKAYLVTLIKGPNGIFALVKIDPVIIGQQYGLGQADISEVLIAPRLEGDTLVNISRWPIPVHVFRSLIGDLSHTELISEDEMILIAWAEIYPTEQAARIK
jgi:hypothetical protein